MIGWKALTGATLLAVLLIGSDLQENEAVGRDRKNIPNEIVIPAAKNSDLTAGRPFREEEFMEWNRSQANSGSTRYSSLRQINTTNVNKLSVAWTYHSNDGKANIQCNPVIAGGVIYAPTAGDYITAIDAATGREIWRFKPESHPAQRGLLYWPGSRGTLPRLYFLANRFLYALDAGTGKPVQEFGTEGRVAMSDAPLPAGIGVVAPAIFQDVLIAPYMNVVKGMRVSDGKPLWHFDLIPKPGEYGSDTWSTRERGVHCWGGMSLDEKRGIAYISTGSPHPNMVGIHHAGTNLFANSVVALDAKTGGRNWHFQEIRHDIWDLDIPAPPVLVTVQRDGKRVDAVAQVTKIGNTLLLDRVSGQPLFPFRLRRAPESTISGEQTWPYQPDLELPEPFARQVFTKDDVTNISPEARDFVLGKIANARYGWFEPFQENVPTVFYGIHGGAEWTGASFDPETGWLYVSANELPWIITVSKVQKMQTMTSSPGRKIYLTKCAACHSANGEGSGMAPPLAGLSGRYTDATMQALIEKGRNAMPAIKIDSEQIKPLLDYLLGRETQTSKSNQKEAGYGFSGFHKLLDAEDYPGSAPPWGTLNAINLNTGKLAWKVPLGEYEALEKRGIPTTGTENFGGATVTAGGLVFCAGTRDKKIRAFDKNTGKELWQHELPFGGYAPPSVYSVAGRQFIVIAATGGGKLGGELGDAYVAFALPESK